jgi:mannose-6-phosphate isomerase-like protein (cupin superfamily)
MATFQPDQLTFAQGLERIKRAMAQVPEFRQGKIVTSRTPGAEKLTELLKTEKVPGGFSKYQLPVYFEGGPGTQFFVTVGEPGAEVGTHSHDEGDGFRYIASGSIIFEGQELTAGDWIYIPRGQSYSFRVRVIVIICSCYQCCC